MNPQLKRALEYISNTGGSPDIIQFDEDHEPIGPRLREQLKQAELIYECEGRIHKCSYQPAEKMMTLDRPIRHSGNARHRLKQNPLERQYAEMWRQKQDYRLLEYLMGDGENRGAVSDRDELVAATVIQWLGSPVGQYFLRDVNSLPEPYADL